VDEEQRFGRRAKERLKEMRKNVHALALSATPIPRTLHMSLVGLRDMSRSKLPRATAGDSDLGGAFQRRISPRAIENEMARDGQVYFIHNRVESIHSLASLVTKLVLRPASWFGHGQMGEKGAGALMLNSSATEATSS